MQSEVASPSQARNTPPSKTPILFSAVVFPGWGQFLQRRRIAGFVYVIATSVALTVFLAVFAKYFHHLAQDWVDKLFGVYEPGAEAPSARSMLHPGLYLLAIYVANLYDVWHAWYRQTLEWRKTASPEGTAQK